MMKRILRIIILIIIFNVSFVDALEFDISSKNVIIYNMNDDKMLYELDSKEKVQIASLTKIMTAIVAIENIKDINEEVVLDNKVFNGIEDYAQAGFKVGDKVTYLDLLYGVILPSGADAVNGIVLNVSGSNEEFVKLMNTKASELGLKSTNFDNAIGMDSDNNYSSAYDLAKLLMYALKNDTFKKIYTTKKYEVKSLNLKMNSTLISYGKKYSIENIKGAKSGYTDGAGVCLSSIATYNNIDYLLITLGASTRNRANGVIDSLEIYNYFDKNYGYKTIIDNKQVFDEIDVKWGKKNTYKIMANSKIDLYLKNSVTDDDLKYEYSGVKELNYKYKKGDKLGIITVSLDGDDIYKYDVYLNENLEYYHPVLYGIIVFSIILMLISIKMMNSSSKKKKSKKKK